MVLAVPFPVLLHEQIVYKRLELAGTNSLKEIPEKLIRKSSALAAHFGDSCSRT